jgi:hypothetical protein
MIISHSHKFIFIKPLKTAGTSIEAALSQYCSNNDIVTSLNDFWFNRDKNGEWVHKAMNDEGFQQHDDAQTIKNRIPPETWDSYLKFSMTRNPWDRALSYFSWKQRRFPELRPKKSFYHYLGIPYNELRKTKEIFSQFLKNDLPNNDQFYLINGKLCVDHIVRYEHLVEDFEQLCKLIGLPPIKIPHLKAGIRRGKDHYSKYYNKESQSLVASKHMNDIKLFNYTFEKV